jgi:hypothetical protein
MQNSAPVMLQLPGELLWPQECSATSATLPTLVLLVPPVAHQTLEARLLQTHDLA